MKEIRRLLLQVLYMRKFIAGYRYTCIAHTDFTFFENHHNILLEDGWEQDGDTFADFTKVKCWYRKKTL